LEVKGYTGTVVFDGQSITIIRSGVGRVTGGGRGQIRIPVSNVTAVMWKPAGPMLNGYIHFSIPGTNMMSRNRSSNIRLSQNTVSFLRSQMQEFEALRDAVEAAIQRGTQPAVVTASIPEQIAQFAALRDQGILTEEEFAAKKAALLSQT
jgi:hypothetical protein